jgi:hypothetical protein
MSSDDQGILSLLLATPTIPSPPSRFSTSTSSVLSGKRMISVRLHRCVDKQCNTRIPISNVLNTEVEFR